MWGGEVWGLGVTLHSTGNSYWGLVWKKNVGWGWGGGLHTLVPVKEKGGINEAIKAPGSLKGIVGGRRAG